MRAIIAEFRALAVAFNVAVILVHHTRKGTITPGDLDASRGASATGGGVRVALTLLTMSEADAELLGIPEDRVTRSQYVRLDSAKHNYAGIEDAQWYEKRLYTLGNGEVVPAAVPWKPPNLRALITPTVAKRIVDEIDGGIDGGKRRYSDARAAKDRAAWRIVQQHIPAFNEKLARKLIEDWIKAGLLEKREYRDEVYRRTQDGLFANREKMAGWDAR
jgi:hypothetical protein